MLKTSLNLVKEILVRAAALPCTASLSRVGEVWAHTGRSRAVVVPD
ncbi:hypothetical protein [Micromonospora fulviviridis]|uniref:Uncharacterized protein n=1 Tax=Micromonospora fulviviridis TaxID=47860 RepID=A0ABV2VVI8_9ACTN